MLLIPCVVHGHSLFMKHLLLCTSSRRDDCAQLEMMMVVVLIIKNIRAMCCKAGSSRRPTHEQEY